MTGKEQIPLPKCTECVHCEYDYGDDSSGIPGHILCVKDEERVLDLQKQNYAPECPLYISGVIPT